MASRGRGREGAVFDWLPIYSVPGVTSDTPCVTAWHGRAGQNVARIGGMAVGVALRGVAWRGVAWCASTAGWLASLLTDTPMTVIQGVFVNRCSGVCSTTRHITQWCWSEAGVKPEGRDETGVKLE